LDNDERPKYFSKPKLHQKKIMMIVWWCSTEIIHYNFLKPGEIITSEKYCLEINKMHQWLHQRPALINRKRSILLHNNAHPYVATDSVETEWTWLRNFASLSILEPLANQLSLLQTSWLLLIGKKSLITKLLLKMPSENSKTIC